MSKLKNKLWLRNTIFILTQPFLPPTGILPIIIHEAAHWLTAVFIGVPTSDIKIGFYGINPGVEIPTSTPPEYVPFFFYSGGFTSGIFLLLLYFLYWVKIYRRNPSTTYWIMSMFITISVAIQFYIGVLEGKYYTYYGSHINQFQLLIFIIATSTFHVAVFYFVNHQKEKTLE